MKKLKYEDEQIPISSKSNNPDRLAAELDKINPVGSYHVYDLIERGMFTGDFIMDHRMVYVGRQCLGAQVIAHFLEINNGSGRNVIPKNVDYYTLASYLNITTTEMVEAVRQASREGKPVIQDGIVRLSHMRDLLPFIPDGAVNRTKRVLIDEITEYEGLARALTAIIVRKFGYEFEELLQNAWLGVIDAAQRYDPSLGWKFETYAQKRIVGEMSDIKRRDNIYNRGTQRLVGRETRVINRLHKQLGSEPQQEEVAVEMGMTPEKYEAYRIRIQMLSLFARVGHEPAECQRAVAYFGSVYPFKAVHVSHDPLDELIAEEQRKNLRQSVAQLSPREKQIIKLYYDGKLTMKRIGKYIGVSESRVSQLHTGAVRKLRESMADN